jgi:hypothetical protein
MPALCTDPAEDALQHACNCEQPERCTWPGHSAGVRAPGCGETPLSYDEVAFAVRAGLLAPTPRLGSSPATPSAGNSSRDRGLLRGLLKGVDWS